MLFCSCVFQSFSIAVASLGGGWRAGLGAFRAFFRLCLFGFVGFLFLLVSGNDCGLNPPMVYSTDRSKAVVPVLVADKSKQAQIEQTYEKHYD